jgi:hypothetical protein
VSWDVRFHKLLTFADADNPMLLVTLRRADVEFPFEAYLDSGCEKTIFSGDLLEQLGWRARPAGDAKIKRFLPSRGEFVAASPIEVELQLESGDRFEMEIFGSHQKLNRNLLGRDLLCHGLFGMDLRRQRLFLSSYRELDLGEIYLNLEE